ncbi:hypothetical protein [Parachryseolinea silvisoli]|jgi:hypothetical protein|uniref:hypothetical protein n=1 Tax=Parachryseolinea silvisoli TaxID=2873601 RepID=UPI002265B2EE|nr:hypothetical protein [Parachryseolinea silvisoli]MCD9018902.1 hypothetical protein [Parachryseolinea silvisoli]
MKNLMLVMLALVISVASVLYTQSHPLPPPHFYGYDPDTLKCTKGDIEGTCGDGTAVRCTVTIDEYFGIPAFDHKVGSNVCMYPSFRASN